MPDPSVVAVANSPRVSVEVTDKRSTKVLLTETGSFGETYNRFVSRNEVSELVQGAFRTELGNRGFEEGSGGNLVDVSISFFQGQFLRTSFSGDLVASIGMQVTVRRRDGSVAFDRFVLGQSQEWEKTHPPPSKLTARVGNFFEDALQDAIAEVFSDPKFLSALKT